LNAFGAARFTDYLRELNELAEAKPRCEINGG
jgi:hypothetical protein